MREGFPFSNILGVSRYAGMSKGARRAWAWGAIGVFLLLCAGIAVSEWYAYTHNVPYYENVNKEAK
jgi:hypothetical protein